MQLGYIGLGKMGKNMVLRLLEHQHQVVAWNRSPEPVAEVVAAGATAAADLRDLVHQLSAPRVVWLMLPAGQVTDEKLRELADLLDAGDIVIDGANSFYKDSIQHAELLKAKGVRFLDAGVSGGPAGARSGACVMVGGEQSDCAEVEELFKAIALPDGYQFFAGHGAGHFVKMVHNGIEYGMMQAIAEGFAVMKASQFELDLEQVARIYQTRSVIESRLVGWMQSGYAHFGQNLTEVSSTIGHTGEGEWTIKTAQELGVPTPVIAESFQFRVRSAAEPSYTAKVVSMLRHEFGGHAVQTDISTQPQQGAI